MAPTIAVSQLEMSKNSSIGSAPKSTPARNPPRIAPTTPIKVVMMRPPGSSPGRSALAIKPASRPRMMKAMMPIFVSFARVCTPTAATTTTEGGADGAAVFTSACGSCHTLEAAGTSGTTGPNLDDVQPDAETVEEQVRNGGGGMPAFEGQLSDQEIEAVATY